MSLLRFLAFVFLLSTTSVLPAATPAPVPIALPEGVGKEAVYLAASSVSKGLQGTEVPFIAGKLICHTAAEVLAGDPNQLVLKAPGYTDSSATLSYEIKEPLAAGVYTVWTRFTQGGVARQAFRFALGVAPDASDERLTFSQTAQSWDTQWRKAEGTLVIYPDEKVIEISIEGKATQQKNIGGFLLKKTGNLPAGLTNEYAALRRKVAQRYRIAPPSAKLVIEEGANAADLDAVYEALADAKDLDSKFAVVIPPVEEVEKMNAQLGLANAPRILLVDAYHAVRHIWAGPFAKPSTALIEDMAAADLKGTVSAPSPDKNGIESTPLNDGRPVAWLTVGGWAGPSGLSLWGLNYEPEICPNPGDPCMVLQFDKLLRKNWEIAARNADAGYAGTPSVDGYVWAKGTFYAHLYVHSEADTSAILHMAQTGIATSGWLNGKELSFKPDWSKQAEKFPPTVKAAAASLDKTDQGAEIAVQRKVAESPRIAALALQSGWNRILLKMVVQHDKGEIFDFKTRITGADGKMLDKVQTSLTDPSPSEICRATAARILPLVYTESPFNLVHEGDPMVLTADLGSVNQSGLNLRSAAAANANREIHPYYPFSGTLELVVTDYDGKEIARKTVDATFPGKVKFDLGATPPKGYYATHLSLFDKDHNLAMVYPPDGFSVIGGVASQKARKKEKKIAVTFYFMGMRYKDLFFPYMQRIGIFRNIGGTNGRSLEFYRYASENGIQLSADLWNYRNPEYLDAYTQETAPYVDSFKSYNEIDGALKERGTPESWVKKAKLDYEAVKKNAPNAVVLGGSFIRPGSGEWFEECVKLGLAQYHDVWDVHCYPQNPPVLGGSMSNSYRETELGVLTVMKKLGMENTKPFWIGETGARACHGYDARRWQADMAAKMIACALSRPDFQKIGFLFPWDYAREQGGIGDISVAHMPAEAAYYTASALVDGFSYEKINKETSIQAAYFGSTIMAWRTSRSSQEVTFSPKGNAPYVQVDVVGRVKELARNGGGSVSVLLGESPVYILSKENYEKLTASKER